MDGDRLSKPEAPENELLHILTSAWEQEVGKGEAEGRRTNALNERMLDLCRWCFQEGWVDISAHVRSHSVIPPYKTATTNTATPWLISVGSPRQQHTKFIWKDVSKGNLTQTNSSEGLLHGERFYSGDRNHDCGHHVLLTSQSTPKKWTKYFPHTMKD